MFRGSRATMYAHRGRFTARAVLYKKMLRMQVGSAPAEITEAKILRTLDEQNPIHTVVCHWPGQFLEFAFNNIYIGTTMIFTFGWTFALFTALAGLGVYGITLLHKMNKPYREKSREMGEKTGSMLNEIFNNIKMIKLYGWQ